MLSVADFLDGLPEPEHLFLANAIGAGLQQARLAAQCLTDPGPRSENVLQLLACLNHAVSELTAAREFIQQRA
jgi:hypothetical protein